jgi:hypothetical protein
MFNLQTKNIYNRGETYFIGANDCRQDALWQMCSFKKEKTQTHIYGEIIYNPLVSFTPTARSINALDKTDIGVDRFDRVSSIDNTGP